MIRKKKNGNRNHQHLNAIVKDHCAYGEHSSCSWNHDSISKPKRSPEELAEEKRILSDLQMQESFVSRLLENIKLMKLYNEDTDAKLKKSIFVEQANLKYLEEFRVRFNDFQEKIFHIELSHILLLSLSSDVLESYPELQDLRKASGDAIQLCFVTNRKKRKDLVKLIRRCAYHRRTNSRLSADLQETRLMQIEAGKQVEEMIQNITTCRERITQDMGFDYFVQAYKCFEASNEKFAGILDKHEH